MSATPFREAFDLARDAGARLGIPAAITDRGRRVRLGQDIVFDRQQPAAINAQRLEAVKTMAGLEGPPC